MEFSGTKLEHVEVRPPISRQVSQIVTLELKSINYPWLGRGILLFVFILFFCIPDRQEEARTIGGPPIPRNSLFDVSEWKTFTTPTVECPNLVLAFITGCSESEVPTVWAPPR